MKIPNGWKRIAVIAGSIAAIGGAVTVLAPYAPWAPRVTFALATENTMARLDNQLITLLTLEAQAQATGDTVAVRRLKVWILAKEREKATLEKLKERHE